MSHSRVKDQDRWDSDSEDESTHTAVITEPVKGTKEDDSDDDEFQFKPSSAPQTKAKDKGSGTVKQQTHSNLPFDPIRREESRLKGLQKELTYLEQDIDKYGWNNLTSKEQQNITYKRNLLSLTRSKLELHASKDSTYVLPESYVTEDGQIDRKRKQEVLKSVSSSQIGSNTRRSDYEKWEETQLSKKMKINHPDDIIVENKTGKVYEYVFDESQHVEFTTTSENQLNSTDTVDQDQDQDQEQDNSKPKTIAEVRKTLPVYQYRDELIQAINDHQVLIIVGETGSGKTTQLPQYLYESGYSSKGLQIACTQPRRVAATSVATRVAEEMGVKLGEEVGYSIRFDERSCESTKVKYMTDGMLLREFMTDPLVSKYSAIMIDEAHERTISSDVLLGLLKNVLKMRPDLRVLISSATMNAEKFSDFFGDVPIFNIPGRRFPVDIYYTKSPEANYIQAAISTVFQIHTTQPEGDILVFLTGQDEIESMQENLQETCNKLGDSISELMICPIYANLPPEQQQKIFDPTPKGSRKVVLATNIAETSITIDGIVFVIDPGMVKENVYSPQTGMESLVVTSCSKASVDQRAGRAGRVGPGKCFRLFTNWAYHHELKPNPTPEILRVNLASVVLLLLSLGVSDLLKFQFLDAPSKTGLMKAFELLYSLGALNGKGKLTTLGKTMSQFPLDPKLSKVLITSTSYNCTKEIITVIAMMGEASSLFYAPKEKKAQALSARESFNQGCDHLTFLDVYQKWEDAGFSKQWCSDYFVQYKSLQRAKINANVNFQSSRERISRTLISGLFTNISKLTSLGNYKSLKSQQTMSIHPSSVLSKVKPPPKVVLYNELVLTSKEFMRGVIEIQESWVYEVVPFYFTQAEKEEFEKNKGKVKLGRK
ncbi:hypothetical protein WICPIJ_010011 [Wickerhamomyces pijperi]|uniref:RNA helicase n=1 Tax=Wickerhamomyces pijperi TaxID=599730 RepID=A0A9P8PI09_WICPI|nr:hypothetical protein WICPIJ_010011 [Wickerhamomyces pijperi]